jgi:hypothetical protein
MQKRLLEVGHDIGELTTEARTCLQTLGVSSATTLGIEKEITGRFLIFLAEDFSLAADEKYVDIHRSQCNEPGAENQQFFSIEVQCTSTFDCLLKEHQESRSREKCNKCLLHATDDKNETAENHKSDDIRILQKRQHINAREYVIQPLEIKLF